MLSPGAAAVARRAYMMSLVQNQPARIECRSKQITEEIALSERGPHAPRAKKNYKRRRTRWHCAKQSAKYPSHHRLKEIILPNLPSGALTYPRDDCPTYKRYQEISEFAWFRRAPPH